jgi:hypothetical protein
MRQARKPLATHCGATARNSAGLCVWWAHQVAVPSPLPGTPSHWAAARDGPCNSAIPSLERMKHPGSWWRATWAGTAPALHRHHGPSLCSTVPDDRRPLRYRPHAPHRLPRHCGRADGRDGPAVVRRRRVPEVPALRAAGAWVCPGALRRLWVRADVAVLVQGRGFCPSCGGRRMAERAAHLVDHVLPPDVPVRQWVLSVPHRLRYRLAYDHRLCRTVLGVFVRALRLAYRLAQPPRALPHAGARRRFRGGGGRDVAVSPGCCADGRGR